jgi:hypothetical protein
MASQQTPAPIRSGRKPGSKAPTTDRVKARRAEIKRLFARGISKRETAKRLKIGRTSVRRVLTPVPIAGGAPSADQKSPNLRALSAYVSDTIKIGIRGRVFCSFLALELKQELESRMNSI